MNKLKVEQRIKELLVELENEKIHVERMKIFSELEKLKELRESYKWKIDWMAIAKIIGAGTAVAVAGSILRYEDDGEIVSTRAFSILTGLL